MKRLISANVATMVATSTVLFGLTLLSLTSPSMAQQQGEAATDNKHHCYYSSTSANATTTISLQDLTNNQSITEPIDSFTITQQWSPMLFIDPGNSSISHASCGEGQVAIGGGYQVSNPAVEMLFNGPSLSVNAYAVQAYNGDSSPSSVQVYAICLGGEGLTPAEATEAQEGSRQ